MAALQRLKAADRSVGAAVAARFPSVQLRGSVGFGGTQLTETFDDYIYSAMASITQPIWHGGETSAEVARSRAELEERVADYTNTVLEALAEIDSALASIEQGRARALALEEEVEAARAALALAELEYRAGIKDFMAVLDAETQLYPAELQLVAARRQHLGAWIELYSALGGDRTNSLAAPPDLEIQR